MGRNPARRKPRVMPPAPAKRSMRLGCSSNRPSGGRNYVGVILCTNMCSLKLLSVEGTVGPKRALGAERPRLADGGGEVERPQPQLSRPSTGGEAGRQVPQLRVGVGPAAAGEPEVAAQHSGDDPVHDWQIPS